MYDFLGSVTIIMSNVERGRGLGDWFDIIQVPSGSLLTHLFSVSEGHIIRYFVAQLS